MARRPKPPAPKRTQAEMIREVLSDRIVHGILRPGEALDETSLAEEFAVSRTPIREALRQLETIGLASSRPHRGTVVTEISEAELHDMFRVMGELEALCARMSAEAMTGAERDALAVLHAEGATLVEAGAIEPYRLHNDRFHQSLYAGAHNAFLEGLVQSVQRRLQPFRRLQFEALHRIESSQREHGLVVAAIIDGHPEGAAQAMLRHLSVVEETVERTVAAIDGGGAARFPAPDSEHARRQG